MDKIPWVGNLDNKTSDNKKWTKDMKKEFTENTKTCVFLLIIRECNRNDMDEIDRNPNIWQHTLLDDHRENGLSYIFLLRKVYKDRILIKGILV